MKEVSYILFFALVMYCCNYSGVITKSDDLSDGWSYSETVELRADQAVDLVIIHDDSYQYQNLYLTISTDGWSDTVSISLASEKGYWMGRRRAGSQYELTYPLSEAHDDEGMVIKINQYSRDSTLMGIKHLGLIAAQ